MRILQLTNKIPYPPKDGGAIATLNLSKGFKEMGHSVTILGMNTTKHFFDIKDIPNTLSKKIQFIGVEVNTSIRPLHAIKNLFFSDLPYNAERFISEQFKHRLETLLQSNEFDVIQLEGLYMALYLQTIRIHSKALVALRAHNIEHEIWERIAERQNNPLLKHYYRILAKRVKKLKLSIMNKYDVLVPITQRDGEKFNSLGNNKPMHFTPAGIDTTQLLPEPGKINYNTVFYIGTLDWIPNQEGLGWFMQNVWNELSGMHPELQLFIAGRNAPGWLKKDLSAQKVTFLGEIDDAYTFIKKNTVMIVPLFSGSGMRVKIIEGMALGKAIVTTHIGAEGIPATHNKNIIIASNADDFINEISMLVKNKKKIEDIGKNAVMFVREKFDNIRISSSLIDFYSKLI